MLRAPSLIGLAGSVSPARLAASIDTQRRLDREPSVVELLPGLVTSALLGVCDVKGVPLRFTEEVLGREGIFRVDVESKELTDTAFELLNREAVSQVIWHVFYWYRLRRACLGAAILERTADENVYSATVLGADDLMAGVFADACLRKGVRVTAPGSGPFTFSRRLRTIWSSGRVRIPVHEGAARWLKLSSVLLRSLGKRERATPVDCLILTTLPTEKTTWMSIIEGMPDALRVGLTSKSPKLLRGAPAGTPLFNLRAWVRLNGLARWLERYKEHLKAARMVSDTVRNLTWRGLDLGEFARGWLVVMLRQVFWVLLSQAAAIEELINAVKPKILVTLTERDEFVNLACQIAKVKGLRTLSIESHDMIWDTPLFGRIAADRMALSGDYSAGIYLKGGAPEEKLVVTGQPSFDGLIKYRNGKKEGEERLLVVITQPLDVAMTPDVRREMLRGALLAGSMVPRLRVVVKPHPRENLDDLRLVLGELDAPPVTLLSKKTNLYALLASSDVVLTAFSTVGVEAIMLGRPVVVFKTDEKRAFLPYVDSDAVLRAGNTDKVVRAVDRALSDADVKESLARGRNEYIAHHEYAADGRSTARVIDLILEMVT
jgi:hypothetical protein